VSVPVANDPPLVPTAPAITDAAIDDALRTHFGFEALRRGQREAVSAVAAGRDTLVVMPTGAGKSLVYQLSACLLDGVTVVVSPLIALMKDQVDALTRRGISAVALNSSMPADDYRAGLDALRSGAVRLVYVAPERLRNRGFLRALADASVALLAVDEAHCVSQWGHDFRPDYLQIGRARHRMGDPPTVALTATATPRVQEDILATLDVAHAERVVTGFNRPNLTFSVQSTPTANDKRRALRSLLEEETGPGLVYVGTRKQCEDVTRFIRDEVGREVRAYHAGLPDAERTEVQDAFMTGDLDLVVATNAFGMGVDRADVRFVVHWGIPSTLEAYYQEAGRAGRDGAPAEALLLYATHDASLREWFIDQHAPAERALRSIHRHLVRQAGEEGSATVDQEALADRVDQHPVGVRVGMSLLERMGVVERGDDFGPLRQYTVNAWDAERAERVLEVTARRQKAKRQALYRMIRYAEADGCRRQILLDHFGDPEPPEAARCCDNCLVAAEIAAAPENGELPPFESLPMASRIALGLLDAVRRLRWSVGRRTLVKLLAGSTAKGMDRREYTGSPYYGRLGFMSQDDIDGLYKQLIAAGYLKVVGAEYPVVELTATGRRALAHREAIALEVPSSARGPSPKTRTEASLPRKPLDEATVDLLGALKAWRTEQARAQEVPPYVVFNDRTLEALARARPQDDGALLEVKGIGPAKLERYGQALLALISEHETV
jgi:ATP-dependent DNA helicase RecQ